MSLICATPVVRRKSAMTGADEKGDEAFNDEGGGGTRADEYI